MSDLGAIGSVASALSGVARFDTPAWLILLPLVLLPWWRSGGTPAVHRWTALLPNDGLSRTIDLALRAFASLLILLLILALAGLARVGQPVERIATGAEIVILLDRSRSMDEPLMGATSEERLPKRTVAKQRLLEFVAARPDDRFAMMLFSTNALLVSDFSPRHTMVEAGIEVSDSGRGLSETEIGPGLLAALGLFKNRPYRGPRVVLLVSDGGSHLTPEVRDLLSRTIRADRITLYWIYLRSRFSPGLLADRELTSAEKDAVPEHFLHRFLQSTGMPYRAFEATSPDAMTQAIEEIKRLEDRPLRYTEVPPDSPLERPLLAAALVTIVLLLATPGVGWSPGAVLARLQQLRLRRLAGSRRDPQPPRP